MDVTRRERALHFDSVTKRFADRDFRSVVAIDNLTMSVRAGEFVALLGPSGCGKTTLLRLAAGLETASRGQVLFEEVAVSGPSPDRGLVFQAYNAFPWLTVRQNVAFGLDRDAARTPSQEEEVLRWLEVTGLSEFAESYPKVLSGGMRQRMALARTMIVRPRLLLLDEPFGALDELTRIEMQALLQRVVGDSNCTVLLVTHDIREAVLLSDRVVVLSPRPGRIVVILESTLPKPRTPDLMRTGEFERLHSEVIRYLSGDCGGNTQ